MKALSFREVIASIKEGEEYVNTKKTYAVKSIYMSGGNIAVCTDQRADRFVVDDRMKFKKLMKEYIFQEAFEAFEEGKVIESVVTKCKFKKGILQGQSMIYSELKGKWVNLLKGHGIEIEEIRGNWYIYDNESV